MATRLKRKDEGKVDDDFLASVRGHEVTDDNEPSAKRDNADKVTVNVKVTVATHKAWKQFCLDYDTTITTAVKVAMRRYIKSVQEGGDL